MIGSAEFGNIQDMLSKMVADDPPKGVDSGDPQFAYFELATDDTSESGVWSGTVGGFAIESYSISEVMVMLAGKLRVTDANGKATELSKGDMFYIPKGWKGRWDILEDMQKAYTIIY